MAFYGDFVGTIFFFFFLWILVILLNVHRVKVLCSHTFKHFSTVQFNIHLYKAKI